MEYRYGVSKTYNILQWLLYTKHLIIPIILQYDDMEYCKTCLIMEYPFGSMYWICFSRQSSGHNCHPTLELCRSSPDPAQRMGRLLATRSITHH